MNVQVGIEKFQIVAPDGTQSDPALFGSAAILDWNDERYMCFMIEDDIENGKEPVVEKILSVDSVVTTYEEVAFQDEEEEEEVEPGGDEEEDEREEDEVGDIQG